MNAPPAAPVLAYGLGNGLYLNLTNACTLACVFCPKVRGHDYTMGPYDLRLTTEPSAEEIWQAAVESCVDAYSEVVFTGFGEPTGRLSVVLDLARRLKRAGVQRVRLDTDGLANLREGRDVVPELAAAGLNAVSVSLNAHDAATYARHCRSKFGEAAYAGVQDFIRSAVTHLSEVTASAVGYPGISEEKCRQAAESLGARFRWRPYQPR